MDNTFTNSLIWNIDNIQEGTEMIYRIFSEYYNLKPDFTLIDYSLYVPSKRCFIATAAYGTPFSDEIDILRFWRDSFLKTSWLGRRFVDFYYRTSPPIADFISERDTVRTIVRTILNPIVKGLKKHYRK